MAGPCCPATGWGVTVDTFGIAPFLLWLASCGGCIPHGIRLPLRGATSPEGRAAVPSAQAPTARRPASHGSCTSVDSRRPLAVPSRRVSTTAHLVTVAPDGLGSRRAVRHAAGREPGALCLLWLRTCGVTPSG